MPEGTINKVSFKVTLSNELRTFINGADISTTKTSLSLSSSAKSFSSGIFNVSTSFIVSTTTLLYGSSTTVGWFSAGGSSGHSGSPGQVGPTGPSPSSVILILNRAFADAPSLLKAKTFSVKEVSLVRFLETKTNSSFKVGAPIGLTIVKMFPGMDVAIVTSAPSFAAKIFERGIFKESVSFMVTV